MRWRESWRADPQGARIADGHYNRQKVGSPQFVPPGRCIVLVIPKIALWVTSWPFPEYVKHAWPGAWINSTFRNAYKRKSESDRDYLSSDLIVEAIAATRWFWPDAPEPHGLITFVDERKVKRKRDPGRCYLRAGFTQLRDADGEPIRTKEEGHLVFQMLPHEMPPAEPPIGASLRLAIG